MEYLIGQYKTSKTAGKTKHLGELDHVSRLPEVLVLVFALQGISGEETKHSAHRLKIS